MEIVHLILGKANPNRMNGVNKVVYQLASRQSLSKRDVSIWGITKDLNHNYGERPFQTLLFFLAMVTIFIALAAFVLDRYILVY